VTGHGGTETRRYTFSVLPCLRGPFRAGVLLALVLLAGRIEAQAPATYFCPMHAHVRLHGPGACPLCRMPLVAADALDARDYRLELTAAPNPPAAGQPFRLRLAVGHPDSDELVRDFALVHERRYHLFVISHDLEHYAHVHPELETDGAFALDVTLPRAGYYKIFSDFLPTGGTPQVIGRSLATRGFDGDLASTAARLVPDKTFTKIAGGVALELQLPAEGLMAGRDEKFVYRLTDASTGAPIRDLEPYLGAWGHSLIMSEDTLSFVHAHPIELLPEGATTGGGPTLTFTGLLPKAGRYRIWTQIKRRGEVFTVPFTVAVRPSTS
jgi:hypothetical protein